MEQREKEYGGGGDEVVEVGVGPLQQKLLVAALL
jgi:hypothetical protein